MSDPAATRPAGPARPWPVVLVHGTRTSHSQWDPQVPALRAAGHHVLAPDLPGHGARRGEPFTLEAAQSVIEGAARTAHEATALPVHLVGSSLGGMLAIRSAARLGAADRADAGTDRAGASPVLGSLVACGAAVQPTPLTARLYARLITATDLLPAMRRGSEAFPFTWLLGRDGARAYLRGELSRVPVPVTFLHGRFEQLRLHERSFTAAAPQGRLELLPYGNHMLNLVRAERFTPDLLRVLARAERPTSPGTTQDRLGP